jgi:hypothetical protein
MLRRTLNRILGLMSVYLVVSLPLHGQNVCRLRLPSTFNINDSLSLVFRCYMTLVIHNKLLNNVQIDQSVRINMMSQAH